jgi:hypothetical protein
MLAIASHKELTEAYFQVSYTVRYDTSTKALELDRLFVRV